MIFAPKSKQKLNSPEIEVSLARILNFLAVRPRSQVEIQKRLIRYNVSPEEQAVILTRLSSMRLLDDLSFAKYLIESRRSQGRSTRHISYELTLHGFAREQINSLLRKGPSEKETLKRVIEQKTHLPRLKLLSYLARRGYPLELVKEALTEYNKDINRNS